MWGNLSGLRTPRRGKAAKIFSGNPWRRSPDEYPAVGRWDPAALTSYNASGGRIHPTSTPDLGIPRGR